MGIMTLEEAIAQLANLPNSRDREAVAVLKDEIDHATAEEGDHLSKASRRMVNTVMNDRDALREKVRKVVAALRRYGRHLGHCAALVAPTDPDGATISANACTCGLDDAIERRCWYPYHPPECRGDTPKCAREWNGCTPAEP